MSVSLDPIRLYEQELLQKADVLALALAGLKVSDHARAAHTLSEITQRLERVLHSDGHDTAKPAGSVEPSRPYLVPASRGDDTEEFILDILADSPKGMSVQEIFDHMDEAQIGMKRQTLVVRLHRMAHAGKLAALTHGHYALSEAERGRRVR